MKEQNYANHARYVTGFHFVLLPVIFLCTLASFVNIWMQLSAGENIFSAILISLLFICCLSGAFFTRRFATNLQDRAIRAQETLRYFILTRNPLDKRITPAQIIALRFASDDEFVTLAERAANEELTPDEIKKEIKQWRADYHRV